MHSRQQYLRNQSGLTHHRMCLYCQSTGSTPQGSRSCCLTLGPHQEGHPCRAAESMTAPPCWPPNASAVTLVACLHSEHDHKSPGFEQIRVTLKSTSGGGLEANLNVGQRAVLCGGHICAHRRLCNHSCRLAGQSRPNPVCM